MIIESWTTSVGSVEVLVYDHGLSSPPGDIQYYRGQSDASIQSNRTSQSGIKSGSEKYASLCTLIWKGNQVKDCQVFRRVPCSSRTTRAEMLAMFALARRGTELKIEKFSVITDCMEVDRNNRGVGLIEKNAKDSDVRMATRYVIGSYKSLISRWEPREKNMFADSILKKAEVHEEHLNMELLLQSWAHHLSGLPLFKIHQNQDKIKQKIIDAHVTGLRRFRKEWKLEVTGEDAKFESLVNIVHSLSPDYVVVYVKDEQCAYLVKEHAPKILHRYSYKATVYKMEHCYTVTLTGDLSPAKEHLRVIYDTSARIADHEDMGWGQTGNVLNVTFLTPEEKQLVCYKGLPEVSPICLLFFGTYDRRFVKVKWN